MVPAQGGEMKYTVVQAPAGEVCGLILEVDNKKDFTDFGNFRKLYKTKTKLDNSRLASTLQVSYTNLAGDNIIARYEPNGSFTEPMFDFGYGVIKPAVILQSESWQQPKWPQGEGHGRLAQWWVNGREVDKNRYWPVYSGPGLYVGKGRLELQLPGSPQYKIDYTGLRPVFSGDNK
jgi:hypothetical protein